MKKAKVRYNVIHLLVIGLTAVLFIFQYYDIKEVFSKRNGYQILIIASTVLIVHLIKASRLYLALYETNIDTKSYIKIYCKTIPVSVVLPFKAGEFFRMYCYGMKMDNMLRGIVIVVLDRFMDTIALITVILLIWIFFGGQVTAFIGMLLLFFIFVLMIYFVFPRVYLFWKKNLLKEKATERKLAILKALHTSNNVYCEIVSVSKGRGIILYFLSLIAWAIEIGSLVLLLGVREEVQMNNTIAKHLYSAMGSGYSMELRQFIFLSVIMMISGYVVVKLYELKSRKKEV